MSAGHSSDVSVAESLKGLNLHDYVDIAIRRKWWILIPLIIVSVGTSVAVIRTPDVYRSETVIVVDPQKVSDTVVQSTLNSGVADRLSTIRQLATSPTRLKSIIEKLNLYPELTSKNNTEGAIEQMQKNINIEVADSGGQRLSTFKIAFFSRTPTQAATVANEIGQMVIKDNLQAREQAFSGAEQFLDSELQETKKQLEQKELEVQRIKSQYVTDLPESKQFHLETLNSLRNQIRASQDRVNQDKQEKIYLQSTMNDGVPATVDLDATTLRTSSPYAVAIQKEEAHLSELEARYGPQYPEVRKTQNRIAELKEKAVQATDEQPVQEQEDASKLAQRAKRSNPVVQAQITKLDQEIEEETRRQATLEPQIALHMSKLEHEPIFEQQISGLMRDYDTLRGHYNRLLDKKLSAQMALELETRQQGERFVILDSAPVPQRPAGPNRPLFSLAGLLGGLLGGLTLAMIIEMTDESVRNESEAARIFGKPVLGDVPRITSTKERRTSLFRATAIVTATVVASVVLGLLLSTISGRYF